ncbi:MAG TPA: L-serine ammonia-lyase, iron-sulfur-dependent, subunit alpha [Kiritimatiellia bacterium]|nr:L-serine ammonia-lyase, iron-sulfur-dependent, subunit alpha [Kiritimatiellia bacterium]HMP35664.1 L-serine ammonia-lyase, iron-sulfur-dependent, subunit alpha [Kiritimatiellia bacterium]
MTPAVESIFETFRIGAGPSSSHSIGPQRAARFFLARQKCPPARIRVTLFGSLSETGRGHLTDRTILTAVHTSSCEIIWDTHTTDIPHPNTLRWEALDADGAVQDTWTVCSIGGGALRDEHGPVAVDLVVTYPIRSLADALAWCEARNLSFWQFVEAHETDLWPRLETVWSAMRASVERGLASTQPLLPGSLRLARRARTTWLRARQVQSPHQDLAQLAAFALAVAEENADAGEIVTAPTCGPAGVVPGLLYYFETARGLPRAEILRALATAGLFGAVIRANASVSGAEVGCQGEIGSACSMAAAAGSYLLGGTLHQIEYAAEIGMEHHLGLTCDPVEGYVQIPCIERNMTACLRAFECASFSLLTDGRHLVSFDDVIEVMYRTGLDIQSAYRETARGGLAALWRKRQAASTIANGTTTTPPPPSGCG